MSVYMFAQEVENAYKEDACFFVNMSTVNERKYNIIYLMLITSQSYFNNFVPSGSEELRMKNCQPFTHRTEY